MATKLEKKVVRQTETNDEQGVPLVIELCAGGKELTLRPKGARTCSRVSIQRVWQLAKQQTALNQPPVRNKPLVKPEPLPAPTQG